MIEQFNSIKMHGINSVEMVDLNLFPKVSDLLYV